MVTHELIRATEKGHKYFVRISRAEALYMYAELSKHTDTTGFIYGIKRIKKGDEK